MSKYRVACSGLNVRSAPSGSLGHPIAQLVEDTIVERVHPFYMPVDGYVEVWAPTGPEDKSSRSATRSYRGWVHLQPVSNSQVSTAGQLIEQKNIDKQDDAARLADECGTLRHKLHEKDAVIEQMVQCMCDVSAYFGPSKMKMFEIWRAKLGKKK